MTLEPIFNAPLAVQIHVYTIVPAAVLGARILWGRKGTRTHKILGRVWVTLMVAAALSSFFIHEIRLVGPYSPIHLLSVLTLVSCTGIVWTARTRRWEAHKRIVQGLYFGGIGVAGLLTLLPGRIMNEVLSGQAIAGLPYAWISGFLGAALVGWSIWRRTLRRAEA